jgi:ParB-like chromosome segregation protein Spo0J
MLLRSEQKLTVHPAANILPAMCDADFQQLKEDIELHGQREPIWIHEGRILDGRNRYRACLELGIKPKIREYKGDDPKDFVLSVNLQRRHLNESQRAMIAAEQTTVTWGGDRSKAQNCALSHGQLAEKFMISERMVDKAAAVLKAAEAETVIRELPELVRQGVVRLSRAEQIAKLSLEEQREIAAQIRDRKRAKAGVSSSAERLARRFEVMAARMARLNEQLVRLVSDADKVEMLMPEPCRRLIDACRTGTKTFSGIADRLEWKSGVRDAKPVPCADAA